ncbi:catalase-2-like [Manduca sexta]|uniref:catalase-2-like n=1 Tax=Manduca sexta TaxID=7130 RepID=UPI00188E98FA|nr:catalase-2-like [Manduca sexta]
MHRFGCVYWIIFLLHRASCYHDYYYNYTLDPVSRQLEEFRAEHPRPIGLLTTSSGEPVEIRDTVTLNTEIFNRNFHTELTSHADRERIQERLVHAKGVGAYGYFEVTNDVSKYTKADVFNGIGKKTPLVGRFSTSIQNLGGPELSRTLKGLAMKMYTKEGNLDFLCLQPRVYLYKDPVMFVPIVRSFRRNPRTNLFDFNMVWDYVSNRPQTLHALLWLQSDVGIPNGYRKMNVFPAHTYEIYNKHGDRYYVKFNFISEQGQDNLTNAQAMVISAMDQDYYSRDLYNAIAEKKYPAWRLEMDVMSLSDIKNIDYDPFDITRLWKEGTYHTIVVGRVVINRRVENNFKDNEQAAYNPANLVPGISGPQDFIFKARRMFYPDTQNYRLGVNHNKIEVNMPRYERTYYRDGVPPLRANMKDAPNYYPNTFNGPVPYVEECRPKESLLILENQTEDLEPSNYFYHNVLENDAHRQRVADNIASSLQNVVPSVLKKTLRVLTLTSTDLGRRVRSSLKALRAAAAKMDPAERYRRLAQCFEMNMNPKY